LNPKNSPTPDILELTIDSLSYSGGRGVGRHDGVVVFVADTAPGDRVRVRVSERKPRFLQAELLEILQPGPSRRQPPCPVAGRCGGCSWQHISYAEQVVQKQKILRDSLRKLHGFEELPFLAAPREFHYRNRIQLQIQNGKRGFFAKRSRDLVSFEKCWIAEDAINAKMARLTAAEIGDARRVELALSEDGEMQVMAGERDPEAALFSQVNTAQNEVLKRRVLELISTAKPDWMMDLYCGAGNLTLPLAGKFPGVALMAVELSRSSIARARARSPALDWRDGDVAKVLAQAQPRPGEGLVILDPPRVGCEAGVIEQMRRHRPRQIIYVSCNPSTFARDAERLQPEYRLDSVQGLDMFPHTEHVELMASLRAAT
jgi:23S rRNA (uracil1939-C5)-methyltransferase